MLEDVEQIGSEKDFAAADRQEKDARFGELIQQIGDLDVCQLAVVVVIEVAVDAALVAAVRQIDLGAERDAKAQRLGTHRFHQRPHTLITVAGQRRCGLISTPVAST